MSYLMGDVTHQTLNIQPTYYKLTINYESLSNENIY